MTKVFYTPTVILKQLLLLYTCLILGQPLLAQRTAEQKAFIESIKLSPEEEAWLNYNYIIKVHPDTWPPFNYWDIKTGTNQGICVEYLRWIAEKTGIHFEYPAMWMPLKHILPALENKQLDLSPSLQKTNERSKYLIYSNQLHTESFCLFGSSSNKTSGNILDEQNIRITCEEGSRTHQYLSKKYMGIQLIPTITEEDGLRKVISHEADFHAGSESVCQYLIKNYYGLGILSQVQRLDYESQGIYMAARNDWPELISIINKSLAAMPQKTKKEIEDNYLNQIDWNKYKDTILWSMACLILVLSITALFLTKSILKQKHQKKRLLQDDLKLQQATKTAGLYFMEYNTKKKIFSINAKTADFLLGDAHATQLSLKDGLNHIYKVDREIIKATLRQGVPGDGKATRLRVLQANGQFIFLNCHVNRDILNNKHTLLLSCLDISREVVHNTHLISTQRLAHIGHFRFNLKLKKYHLSEEACRILKIPPVALTLSLKELIYIIPKAFRHEYFPELKQAVIHKANEYKTSIHIAHKNQHIHFINHFLYNDIGEVIIHEGYIQDISDLKETELLLEEAKNQAIKANKAKSAFLARMSHEIRTPLNAIIGMINLSLKTELNSKQSNFLNKAFSASEMLLTLINDILDFSKIEANKTSLHLTNFNLHNCLNDTYNILTTKASNNGLKLCLDLEEDIPQWIYADELRLKQVLINLITNAIKFTKKGKITVSVKKMEHADTEIALQFCVKDTGIGIPQEKMEVLFQSFMQVDDSLVRQFEGTGLGLAICKRIIELWNGKIWVNSHLNQGSTFHFTFFANKGFQKQQKQQHTPKKIQKQPHILLAEDNLFNQEIGEAIMKEIGAKVTIVDDGIKALQATIKESFDIIFMDIHMPVADGITATRLIRKHFTSDTLPIIAVTAYALTENKSLCLEAGMNDFITKPYHATDITNIIEQWLPDHYTEDASTKKESTKCNTKLINKDDALKYFQTEEKYKHYLSKFLASTPERLETLYYMRKTTQLKELTTLAHTIKGEAGYLGLALLHHTCELVQGCKEEATITKHTDDLIKALTETKVAINEFVQ